MLDEKILGRIEDARLRPAGLPAGLSNCHVPPPLPVSRYANKRFKSVIETAVFIKIKSDAGWRQAFFMDKVL
ncbi:hypothetical protein DP49_3506 [Burkholderia pseudomallei]|nr:hypothetical protein DO73_3050 [Burkholderia pseudomallei]KGD57163.1 hypothetical protein DP49_3506 [Burkholderia pseudomallei]